MGAAPPKRTRDAHPPEGREPPPMAADALNGPGDAQSNPRRVIPPEGREPPPMAADALNVNPPEKIITGGVPAAIVCRLAVILYNRFVI